MRAPGPQERTASRVGIVGIPFDCGAHPIRVGARLGPSAIREQSQLLRPFNPPDFDFDPLAKLQVADWGDVDVVPGQIEDAFAKIERVLDAVYASMSGGSIQTEAFQAMNPPLDLTNCGRIQVSLKTEEQSPGSASMHLVTTTGDVELGTEIIGLEASRQETLEFEVPPIPANLMVKAIRIVFHRDPLHRAQSTRVEVSQFRFLARS